MPAHPPPRRGLYLVTRQTADSAALLRTVQAALRGGARLVQYRDKSADAARRLEQVHALAAACADAGVPLVVNDDVELALACGAAGVHLGEHDGAIADARARLGAGAIIGVSCYDSLERAQALAAQGADYLAFGSFFASPTKPGARRARPALLREAARFGLPRVAIGGITLANAGELVAAGADLLAVVSAVADAADPESAARAFTALYD
jgi:thiamine-phosphate pyrophosphorylase